MVQEVREVGVDDVPVSTEQQFFPLNCRLLGVPPGPVGILFGWEIGFKDRLQHQRRRCDANPIAKIEMPSGRTLPLAFGMYTRLMGSGR